jgi:hypothetical protein
MFEGENWKAGMDGGEGVMSGCVTSLVGEWSAVSRDKGHTGL